MPMSGGEAQPVTSAPRDVQQFAWRPGGKDIAYVVADEPANQKEIDAHNDAFEVGLNDYLATAAAPVYHLWLVPAAGGAARRLTSGAWSLPGDSQAAELSWSPDGKKILFTRVPESAFGASDQSRVQVLDVETGQLSPLGGGDAYSHQAAFSPDGARIVFSQPRDRDFNNENEILVLPAAGGAAVDVTRALDRDILHASWMPDGRSLLVGGHDRTTVGLWIQPLEGRRPANCSGGRRAVLELQRRCARRRRRGDRLRRKRTGAPGRAVLPVLGFGPRAPPDWFERRGRGA